MTCMNWKDEVFAGFKLYAVTDLREADRGYLDKIEAAYRGGADMVQLRAKGLRDGALYDFAREVRRMADRHRKLFFVNDRVDLALSVKADGVHLGQDDLPILEARRLARVAGTSLRIGKSTHSFQQALQAERENADYIAVGPVFATPTKPSYPPVGLALINQVRECLQIPFLAIGGIDLSNMHAVLEAGASRVAVVRAIFGAPDPEQAARALREKIAQQAQSRV